MVAYAQAVVHSEDMKRNQDFETGRALWTEYQSVNGYAFRPTDAGLKNLSRRLDLNIAYLRKMINLFLEA